ncbi:MAG: hypothetical protein ACPGSC_06545 [Granulosicoccaceae bacterium]
MGYALSSSLPLILADSALARASLNMESSVELAPSMAHSTIAVNASGLEHGPAIFGPLNLLLLVVLALGLVSRVDRSQTTSRTLEEPNAFKSESQQFEPLHILEAETSCF